MPVTQCDEVVEVRLAATDPVEDVVDVREFGEAASREPAPLVPAGYLNPLSHGRITPSTTLVEDGAVPSLHGEHHVGIARQPASDLG